MKSRDVHWSLVRDGERVPLRARRAGQRVGLPHFRLYVEGPGMVPVAPYALKPDDPEDGARCSVELATTRRPVDRSQKRRDEPSYLALGRGGTHPGGPPDGPDLELLVLPWPDPPPTSAGD